jgi:hypothetical protein
LVNQTKSVESHYSIVAEEAVQAEKIRDTWYLYGSEIAVLRIYWKCQFALKNATAGYSENLETWYFSFEKGM